MTREDLSILGRFEGLACGCDGELQSGIFDTCEMLSEQIQKLEEEDGER